MQNSRLIALPYSLLGVSSVRDDLFYQSTVSPVGRHDLGSHLFGQVDSSYDLSSPNACRLSPVRCLFTVLNYNYQACTISSSWIRYALDLSSAWGLPHTLT